MLQNPKKALIPALLLVCVAFTWLAFSKPTQAAPLLQLTPFLTPTPGPDGRILYKVQSGDTLLRISLIAGIPLDELRGLNNLTGDNIVVGQELLLGLGGPSVVTPTSGPSPTATQLLPTPTPKQGFGVLCVLLYDDHNGDSIRQEEEPAIRDGAISISNRSGSVSQTANTIPGTEPICFEGMQEGDYSITVGVPEGYNPTTATSFALTLKAGDETYLGFGAQANTATEIQQPVQESGGQSILLGLVGGLLLAAGVGLAIFGTRLLRSK
jgi:LysM repeat protein